MILETEIKSLDMVIEMRLEIMEIVIGAIILEVTSEVIRVVVMVTILEVMMIILEVMVIILKMSVIKETLVVAREVEFRIEIPHLSSRLSQLIVVESVEGRVNAARRSDRRYCLINW